MVHIKFLSRAWNRFHPAFQLALNDCRRKACPRVIQGFTWSRERPIKESSRHEIAPHNTHFRSRPFALVPDRRRRDGFACLHHAARPKRRTSRFKSRRKGSSKSDCGKTRDDSTRRIEILFLGADTEEHSSQKATALFVPAMAREGINVSWTDDLADLNTRNLAKYDTLMAYGNFQTSDRKSCRHRLRERRQGSGRDPSASDMFPEFRRMEAENSSAASSIIMAPSQLSPPPSLRPTTPSCASSRHLKRRTKPMYIRTPLRIALS